MLILFPSVNWKSSFPSARYLSWWFQAKKCRSVMRLLGLGDLGDKKPFFLEPRGGQCAIGSSSAVTSPKHPSFLQTSLIWFKNHLQPLARNCQLVKQCFLLNTIFFGNKVFFLITLFFWSKVFFLIKLILFISITLMFSITRFFLILLLTMLLTEVFWCLQALFLNHARFKPESSFCPGSSFIPRFSSKSISSCSIKLFNQSLVFFFTFFFWSKVFF